MQNEKIADRLLIWKIIKEGKPPLEFKSVCAFVNYLEKNEFEDPKCLVNTLMQHIKSDMTLDELAELIIQINLSKNLKLDLKTVKQHIAYGTNRNKKKLAVKFR